MARSLLDGVLEANLGVAERISVKYKKTFNVKQYESETFESSTEIDLPFSVNGIERLLLKTMLLCSLEYSTYVMAASRKLILPEQFSEQKNLIEANLNAVVNKVKAINPQSKVLEYLKENDLV